MFAVKCEDAPRPSIHRHERPADGRLRIDVPTLFIGATNDVVIAPEHIEGMKPLVNDLTIHMLDCGHWTQQERPEDVNRLILDWCRRG